jgi:hypothetical protein
MAFTMQARGSLLFCTPKRDSRRRASLTARARDLLRAESASRAQAGVHCGLRTRRAIHICVGGGDRLLSREADPCRTIGFRRTEPVH